MEKRESTARVTRWAGSLASLLLGLCLFFAANGAYAAPAPIECGAVVTQNIKLLADVGPCARDGLIVAVNGVSINLNGHKVYATQRFNVGIRLENVSNVSVVGGTVEGFDTGVLIVGGLADKVTYTTVQNNRFGIQVQNAPSSGHQIAKNIATNNRLIGILLSPNVSGATVNMNSVSGNVGLGIVLDGGSSLNTISANDAFDVELRSQDFDAFRTNLTPPLLALVSPNHTPYVNGVDYQVLDASGGIAGSGYDVTGVLVPVGVILSPAATSTDNPIPVDTSTSGCQLSDYVAAGFQGGNIALVQRGTCELDVKAQVAALAGAAGIILFNEGQAPTRTTFDFGNVGFPNVGHLVVGMSYSLGYELYNLSRSGPVIVRIAAHTSAQVIVIAPSTNNNQVVKNSITRAVDENQGQAISAGSYVCGSNEWIKNLFADPLFLGQCLGSGPSGGGVTINSY